MLALPFSVRAVGDSRPANCTFIYYGIGLLLFGQHLARLVPPHLVLPLGKISRLCATAAKIMYNRGINAALAHFSINKFTINTRRNNMNVIRIFVASFIEAMEQSRLARSRVWSRRFCLGR
jgi:hypothetical protein